MELFFSMNFKIGAEGVNTLYSSGTQTFSYQEPQNGGTFEQRLFKDILQHRVWSFSWNLVSASTAGAEITLKADNKQKTRLRAFLERLVLEGCSSSEVLVRWSDSFRNPSPYTIQTLESGGMRMKNSVTFWNWHSLSFHTAIGQVSRGEKVWRGLNCYLKYSFFIRYTIISVKFCVDNPLCSGRLYTPAFLSGSSEEQQTLVLILHLNKIKMWLWFFLPLPHWTSWTAQNEES